jgi:AcrR family transcriptional regulator
MSAQDLRSRRKKAAMLRVQDVAIGLFEKKGFEAVTIEDVARAADVGAASVYRWFTTKEGLVLWDDYDPALFDALRAQLAIRDAIPAVVRALTEQLGAFYEHDKRRILRRADLISRSPALANAARLSVHLLREGLVKVLGAKVKDRLHRELLAAVIAATLETAAEEWRRQRARVPLERLLRTAFQTLERL